MKTKFIRIIKHSHDTLSVIPQGTDGTGTVGTVTMTINVPIALVVCRVWFPSGNAMRDRVWKVNVTKVVAGIDYTNCDWLGGRGQLYV